MFNCLWKGQDEGHNKTKKIIMSSTVENVQPDGSTDRNNDEKLTTNNDDDNNNNNNNNTGKERRRKRRWGDTKSSDTTSNSNITSTTASTPTATSSSSAAPLDSKAKALALKESIKARLAALKAKTASSGGGLKRPLPPAPPPTAVASTAAAAPPPSKRAKHYELDMTVTGPTFGKVTDGVPKPKKKINPYLAHISQEIDTAQSAAQEQQQQNDTTNTTNDSENKYVDARLEAAGHDGVGKKHKRRELKFVEPGHFVDIAERKRQRAANAESAGFVSGRKAGQYVKSSTISSSGYYGTTEVLDDVEDRALAPRAEIGGAILDASKGGGNNLRAMPLVVEWWDMELLPSKLKKQVAKEEGKALSKATRSKMQQLSSLSTSNVKKEDNNDEGENMEIADNELKDKGSDDPPPIDEAEKLRIKCAEQASLSCSKTASLIQHIVPIKPLGEVNKKPVEPVLHLTKKELKKSRKRRREQKQRELQDLQAAGLVEPPEPRLTLSNFIRVMGDQAYVDPSQMERTVQRQVQKRQIAHLERNNAKKLTKAQRKEKRQNKILKDASPTENATGAIHVALFYVKNASHPYHRTKIDLEAQDLNISGGVIECDVPNVACVICEGGPKAIQKYTRLMLVRMKWKGPDEGDDDDDDEEEEDQTEEATGFEGEEGAVPKRKKKKFDKDNKCDLVWTGLATKRQFKGFVFQHCETSDQARKVLKSKGVEYYWDQVLSHASGRGDSLHLKLVDEDEEDNDVFNEKSHDAIDVVMIDA